MKKYSPQLVVLDLRDNPICTDKAYRSTALRKLKHMERCDAGRLHGSPNTAAAAQTGNRQACTPSNRAMVACNTVLACCPLPPRFDGRAVSAEEKERFGEQAGAVTVAMMLEHGSVASRGHVGLAGAANQGGL